MDLQELIYQAYNPDYIEGGGVTPFNVTDDPDGYFVDFSLQLDKFLNKKTSQQLDDSESLLSDSESPNIDSKSPPDDLKVLANESPLILKNDNTRAMVIAMEDQESSEDNFKDDSQIFYEDTGEFDHMERQSGVKFDDSVDYFKINDKFSITDFIKVLNK